MSTLCCVVCPFWHEGKGQFLVHHSLARCRLFAGPWSRWQSGWLAAFLACTAASTQVLQLFPFLTIPVAPFIVYASVRTGIPATFILHPTTLCDADVNAFTKGNFEGTCPFRGKTTVWYCFDGDTYVGQLSFDRKAEPPP